MQTLNKTKPVLPSSKEFEGNADLRVSSLKPDTESFLQKFQRSILDQDKDYPLPEPVINIIQDGQSIPLLTLKSYSLWQGKQKSKKTTLLALAISSYIQPSQYNQGIYFECAEPGVVLFFDNEQGESYAAGTMRLILKLAGLQKSPNLVYCDLREFSPADRPHIIQAGIECTPRVKLVVIDGIVDLMTDFMDAQEGHMHISNIIRLCSLYNIHIAGVLHQNKNDTNARAHVGTISSQKCEIEISTSVDPDDRSQSIVTCVNSRGLPFEQFAIKWEKGSMPGICQDWSKSTAESKRNNKYMNGVQEVTEGVFKPLTSLTHGQAVAAIMNASGKSDKTANRYLKDAAENFKFLTKGSDGLYRLNTDLGSRGHVGSNVGS